MNERVFSQDALAEIESLRHQSPASALSRLNDAPAELLARPEARLTQAELVHELRGAAAARGLLLQLVTEFPNYGAAFVRLARVHDELGERAEWLHCRLRVHRLDAILDAALEPCDEREIERSLDKTAHEALSAAPSWVRERLAPAPLDWRGRPELGAVERGFDPRALVDLREVCAEAAPPTASQASSLQLLIYRTNLLASADDPSELRQNLRIAIRELLGRMA